MPRNSTVDVLCDSDVWTTCPLNDLLNTSFVLLSSGESAWYALTDAGCAIIGARNLSRDLGRVFSAHLEGDASAAPMALGEFDTAKRELCGCELSSRKRRSC